jgi:hypothetical protein
MKFCEQYIIGKGLLCVLSFSFRYSILQFSFNIGTFVADFA